MAILSTVKKVIPYIKEAAGYVLCHISSQAVEMDDGTLLQDKIESMDSEIDGKAPTSHTHDNSDIIGLTPDKAVISSGSGELTTYNNVTSTEVGYLEGVTSNIQDQIDTLNSNLSELNGNMNWSDAITLGSTYGIEMKYRYNAKFVEIQYGGTLPDGVGFGAGTNGYEFPSMPEEFLPGSNIRQPIFCPGNGNKLCIRIYPWATDKWSIAPGSMGLTSVPEYIAGTFVYARR